MKAHPFLFQGHALDLPTPFLLEEEYEELADLVCGSPHSTAGLELLWRELQRAVIVDLRHAPADRVHLHSSVRYTELVRPRHRIAHIIGPLEPAEGAASVSVLSPVGAALIGLRQGAVMPWLAGQNRLRVFRIDAVRDEACATAQLGAARASRRRRLIDEFLSKR
jgi:regulator of nucleoside diphosphate kinase